MPDLIGLNLYPMFSQKIGVRTKSGVRFKMKYAPPEIIVDIAKSYKHYGLPLFISETATLGKVSRRIQWMRDSIGTVKSIRAEGIPLIGYTWWPLFSLVSWGYRQLGRYEASHYVLKMGLWDLANEGDDPLQRVETEAAAEYRRMIKEGLQAVGPIGEGRN